MIARVVVEIGLNREFDYRVPAELEATLQVGSRVSVPFGRTHTRGFVVGFKDHSAFKELKPIGSIVGEKPLLDAPILELARWMADYYAAPIEHVLRTLLPGAVRKHGARHKEQRFATLCPDVLTPDIKGHLQKKAPRQAAVIALLEAGSPLPVSELIATAETTAATLRALEKKGLLSLSTETVPRDPHAGHEYLKTTHLELTAEQQHALARIVHGIDHGDPSVVLLFGVTGSGKTEVYLQAIDYVRARGKGAIILVPEISLTPQTVERFRGRFGNAIAVLHSHLSDGERHDEWHRIHNGEAQIVVGARSAVFAPVQHLGLIVVDEEHEPSYKQEEAPRYHARDVAVMRGHLQKCPVLLGSATPAIETYFNTQRGKYEEVVLTERVDDQKMPSVRVVDMKLEAEKAGRPVVFSTDLIQAVQARISRKEQTILFLNRRGYATSLICPKCGYVAECDMCSVAMTFHRKAQELRCHICGKKENVPGRCPNPECRDPQFRFAGIGTERVEGLVKKFFPQAVMARVDSDTMTNKDAYRQVMGDFRSGKLDILVGTQMLAKGLHFPNVTLVGVIFADSTLHMPEFRAAERTFQLITQVAGRAGRGDVMGEVIVQTYTPFHPAIQAARRLDFAGFFDQELEFRRELFYPPFSHLVCITLRGPKEEQVSQVADQLVHRLTDAVDSSRVKISQAVPAPLAKAKGQYRYQVILRASLTKSMTAPLQQVLAVFKFPARMHHAVDVDAVSMM